MIFLLWEEMIFYQRMELLSKIKKKNNMILSFLLLFRSLSSEKFQPISLFTARDASINDSRLFDIALFFALCYL
jgi:hypothetical protein